jgi:hypothetical protein
MMIRTGYPLRSRIVGCHHRCVNNPPTPDSVVEAFLTTFFGSPSLVVSTFIALNFVWAWWTFGRSVFVSTASVLDRSFDTSRTSSFKIRSSIRTGIAWVLLYGVASLVTQLWAGSQYYPGQGGGLGELVGWSVLFGLITVILNLYIVPSRGPKHGDPNWAPLLGIVNGYVFGLVWAIIAFTSNNGPQPGDWWVCPALSCVGAVGSIFRMRIKSINSWKSSRQNPQ